MNFSRPLTQEKEDVCGVQEQCFFSQTAFWVIKSERFFLAVLCVVKIVPAKSGCANLRIIKPNPGCTERRCLLVYQQAASHCSVITLAPGLSCVTGVTQTNDDLCANVKTTARDTSSFLSHLLCLSMRRKSDRLLRQRGAFYRVLASPLLWFRDRAASLSTQGDGSH